MTNIPATTSNALHYEDDSFNYNILTFENKNVNKTPFYDTSNKKKSKKENNISKSPFHIFQLMCIYTSVYLNSETLQLSNLISSSSHNTSTIGVYVYDLLFTILITLPLIKITNIQGLAFNSILYFIFCNIGGLGFALLGEVPFLHDIAIVKDFWKNLTPSAVCTILFFAIIIIAIAINEIKNACRFKTITRQLLNISIFIGFYIGIFYMLSGGGAQHIHWHIHHAICAGFLSLWFTNWENTIIMCTHAIMMGVVVEGINFYGIQELYLYLSNSSNIVKLEFSFWVSCVFLFFIIIGKLITRKY